jgi:pimeloyl-ACP methyl ester carboxylesterase
MANFRLYGKQPFKVAVLHGGPGAAGEAAPVARELSYMAGVIEPLQTATTIDGQVRELRRVLKKNAVVPVILIGHSWGAWLAFIFAARYPELTAKIILVSSGPFTEQYATSIMPMRLNRLNEAMRIEALSLIASLENPMIKDKNTLMQCFGHLLSKSDSYNPLPEHDEFIKCDYKINQKVSTEAGELRRSGKLLELSRNIKCPVVAVHGDYDPHPAAGVKEPLSQTLQDFRFILLEHCGHEPWLEKEVKDNFYLILKNEISHS